MLAIRGYARSSEFRLMSAKVTDPATGACFHLKAASTVQHTFEYIEFAIILVHACMLGTPMISRCFR